MNKVTIEQFLAEPERFLREAACGEYSTVRFEDGNAAVIIDEAEWTILRQALVICMEHPEWTTKK